MFEIRRLLSCKGKKNCFILAFKSIDLAFSDITVHKVNPLSEKKLYAVISNNRVYQKSRLVYIESPQRPVDGFHSGCTFAFLFNESRGGKTWQKSPLKGHSFQGDSSCLFIQPPFSRSNEEKTFSTSYIKAKVKPQESFSFDLRGTKKKRLLLSPNIHRRRKFVGGEKEGRKEGRRSVAFLFEKSGINYSVRAENIESFFLGARKIWHVRYTINQ